MAQQVHGSKPICTQVSWGHSNVCMWKLLLQGQLSWACTCKCISAVPILRAQSTYAFACTDDPADWYFTWYHTSAAAELEHDSKYTMKTQ